MAKRPFLFLLVFFLVIILGFSADFESLDWTLPFPDVILQDTFAKIDIGSGFYFNPSNFDSALGLYFQMKPVLHFLIFDGTFNVELRTQKQGFDFFIDIANQNASDYFEDVRVKIKQLTIQYAKSAESYGEFLFQPYSSAFEKNWRIDWGLNNWGQIGDGSSTQRNSPVRIGSASNWISASCGEAHTVAIKGDGTLWAWGDNTFSEIGDCTSSTRTTPIQIGKSTNWIQVSCHLFHTLAIKSDGTLWGWGRNDNGQLGNSGGNIPVIVGKDSNWISVSTGYQHTLGIQCNNSTDTFKIYLNHGWNLISSNIYSNYSSIRKIFNNNLPNILIIKSAYDKKKTSPN
jgi:hypothetical protein